MSSSPISDTGVSPDVVVPTDSERKEEYVNRLVSFRRRLRRLLWHVLARQFTLLSVTAVKIAGWIGRQRQPTVCGGYKIMLTGRFDSDNWILAHLGTLSASKECSRIWMVSTNPVPSLAKVRAIYPPKWLIKVLGATGARLLTFLWQVMQKRPHFVGGFHIMVNGIVAVIVGRLAGARSMYFCVGGTAEVRDGGIHSDFESNVFAKMETADAIVERRFLRIVAESDMVITMGTKAISFFRDKGVNTDFHVVSGGIDPRRFHLSNEVPSSDIIFTGRLAPIKRIDIFLQVVRNVVDKIPDIRAVVVGDGKLRDELHSLSMDLGVESNVNFVGCQHYVEKWLHRAKIFVLTSDSEGLSLSMMEAMMCGLPAIVSDVGDLADLVENGVNGYLVPRRSPDLFADRIIELLTDARRLEAFSQAARHSALQYETKATIQRWDNIIANYSKSCEPK